jgi:DNA (cytosine-5)-methyltransferase 1
LILNVLDLFAGAGGLSCGFQMAGHKIICGIDSDKDCKETFLKNHINSKYLVKNMEDVSKNDIQKLLGKNKIDVVIGGPPCQGFSISGKRIVSDPRNQLYNEFLRIVDLVNPKAIMIENVPGFKGLYDGKIFDDLINKLSKRKFQITSKVISADDYGVPQSRKRIFIVGTKKNQYIFPKPNKEKITLWESISDLPLLEKDLDSSNYNSSPKNTYQKFMRKNSKNVQNHVVTNHTEKTKNIINLVPEGKNYKSLPKSLQNTRKVHIAWTRLDGSKPSLTIDTGHRHHFHPKANRIPTVRESARIQSFSDDFIFLGTKTSQYRQVGNAVPPLLACKLSKNLVKSLEDD